MKPSPLEPASSPLFSSLSFPSSFGGAVTSEAVLFLLVIVAAWTVTSPVASTSRASVAVALRSCRLTAPASPTLPVSSEYAVAEVSSAAWFTADTLTLPTDSLSSDFSINAVVLTLTLLIAAVKPAAVLPAA